MAPPSPRRSSRARATNSQSHQSSGSSSTSGRVERNTRSVNRPSSNKSTPSASLSSEPLEDLDDTLLGRRRKRGQDDDTDKVSKTDSYAMTTASDDLQEEEDEAVRCICGAEEYPGRPPLDGPDADYFAAIELTEEVTGFFVQCDVCKVWQHGACVGIFSAESSPDEYFCEQCRKDLHKVHSASNGQKYSKYVPISRPSRSTSRAASITKEGTRSPKNGKNSRQASALQASKRRSTMNSRDRAYEDEQLLRAIEASKEDASHDAPETSTRRTKRGRSDSEDSVAVESQPQSEKFTSTRNPPSVKRQRTSSQSSSPPPPPAPVPIEEPSRDESEDESVTRNGSKKSRNGKTLREKAEKEDKEKQRLEAASKRKGRAERRRGEDSPPSEENTPSIPPKAPAIKSVEPPTPVETPVVQPPVPDTPPTIHQPVGSSHKRGGRGHHKKGKGRNQYTRDRDGENGHSPARSMSRDISKNGEESTGHSKTASDHKHGSKSKSAMATKLSMIEMKRRVSAIMDFISRTQVDLAAEALPVPTLSSGQVSPQKSPAPQINGKSAKDLAIALTNGSTPELPLAGEFRELNCVEMMDVLTRDMVKWQNQYA